MLKAGISVRTDKSFRSKGNGESHHKFSIIGENQIFTGSWNPTLRGTNRNFNHAFWLRSTKLVKKYTREFQQIWNGSSQSHKSSHWDYRWSKIKGGQARVFFAPQDPLKDVITTGSTSNVLHALKTAKFAPGKELENATATLGFLFLSSGTFTPASIIKSTTKAAKLGFKVVNLELGFPGSPS